MELRALHARATKDVDLTCLRRVENPKMRMISIEQQFAEKLHAYSLPRVERVNTRTKDLIDMLLLQLRKIDGKNLRNIAQKIFKVRGTHPLPTVLKPPPSDWTPLYESFARECGITLTMYEVYEELNKLFNYL